MKKAGNWVAIALRPTFLFVAMSSFVVVLLWFVLGSLVPGLSESEVFQKASSATWRALLDNPLGAPYKLLQFGPQYFKHQEPWLLRSASAAVGLLTVCCFYYILNQWYTRRVAILGTILFVCSAWFLHTARLGTESVMYTLLIAVVACTIWLQKSHGHILAVLTGGALLIVLLYIPGMIWFVVPALLWQSQRISGLLSRQNPAVLTVLTLLGVVAMAPLGWGLFQEPSLIRAYFGLPQVFPAPLDIIKNTFSVPYHVFLRGPHNPETWLARLPMLDWFSVVMFVVGGYAYYLKRRLDRTVMLVYVGIMGCILIGLGGPVTLAVLLPFIFLVIAGGLALMLQQWFTVFPHNPVAKTLGACLMTIAVLMSSYYNINHYFIAWPNNPETKQVFTHKS